MRSWLLLLALAAGCAGGAGPLSRPTSRPADPGLERVALIHGGLGPWAVAGYRMGQRALAELGRERGDFALLVEHRSPPAVQWSCIADGIQAATGVSTGKLNLRWERVALAQDTCSRITDRETGQTLDFRPTEAFCERYLNVPREQLDAAGREVAGLADAEIFTLTFE